MINFVSRFSFVFVFIYHREKVGKLLFFFYPIDKVDKLHFNFP